MNIVQQLEAEQLTKLSDGKKIDDFDAGDTVRVNVRIIEGTNERIQAFEGVCIARKDRGLHTSFTVRKISHGEGVERIFPLYSPRVDSVEVIRRGDVRRAKLYYLRGRTGKAARIKEKMDFIQSDDANKESATSKAAARKAARAEKKAAKKAKSKDKPAKKAAEAKAE